MTQFNMEHSDDLLAERYKSTDGPPIVIHIMLTQFDVDGRLHAQLQRYKLCMYL